MGEGEKTPEGAEEPVRKVDPLEDLYYKEDETFIVNVRGIDFKCREISGDDFLEIAQRCTVIMPNGKTDLDKKKYMRELINTCIITPKLDPKRPLKGAVSIALLDGIEERLGLTEVARKKLGLG